ncbi:MAG: hypothetical protein IT424_16340 [Pirellulales bacterium]|nr:hypothetical protein [Pirellulales bacterium]
MVANSHLLRWLAAFVAAASPGCAACWRSDCNCGDACAPVRAVGSAYYGELADEAVCCGRGCLSQSCPHWYEPAPAPRCGGECYPCRECFLAPFGLGCERLGMLCGRCKPAAGPPPATLRPELPPKFLPVPTAPILSPAPPDAPDPQRGDVELDYRRQVIFPAHD